MRQIFVDGVYDYDYSEEVADNGDVMHILFRSNSEHWNSGYRGVEILSITDNGDGFIFNHSKPKKEMDYHYAFYLSILLKMISFNGCKVEISDKKELL
jgi:hypothetical protein